MTDEEALSHMRENTPLNQVRSRLSGIIGEAEQAAMQRQTRTPIESRKHEFQAVESLLSLTEDVGIVRRLND